jgi:nucleotide-binding universal stress UspA family protein
MVQYLAGMNIPRLKEPKILIERSGSSLEAARTLIQFADDLRASWITVSSNARSGLKRMALGSFAESLVLRSHIPVWAFGHGEGVSLNLEQIFFATDFSDASKAAFERVLGEAKQVNAKVTLFHVVTLPKSVMATGAFGSAAYLPLDDYLDEQQSWAEGISREWLQLGKAQGVSVETVVHAGAVNISETLLAEAASRNAGVIAMASQSGPWAAAIVGSHARDVMRQSKCPVWVFGPKCLELEPLKKFG